MKNLPLKLFVGLVAVLLLLFFTIQNQTEVRLTLFGWPKANNTVHIGVVVFVCFAVGLIVGAMMKGGGKKSAGAGGASSGSSSKSK